MGPPTPAGTIASGDGTLIDVFPVERGLLVVDDQRVRLVGRDGTELARFEPGRQITAAAFDGTYLGIADRAVLTALDSDLTAGSDVFLSSWCDSAVIVSGHRFVCGPENDWDRIFTTYDLATGVELVSSEPETYNGIPMGLVPGTDHFVTVTVGSSPSDFHLYEVAASDAAVFIGESPYHGDFAVEDTYAFVGRPATHLVTHEGLLLEIFHEDCLRGMSSFSTGCFTRDGDLGTLAVGERYSAMTQNADGDELFGFLDSSGTRWFDDPICESGCVLHRVDPATRSIVGSTNYDAAILELVTMVHDPYGADAVVLGVHTAGERFDGYTSYEVRSVAYR